MLRLLCVSAGFRNLATSAVLTFRFPFLSELDPSQIGPNLALTGQEVPAAGQVDSLTSTNNYINVRGDTQVSVPLTDGRGGPTLSSSA